MSTKVWIPNRIRSLGGVRLECFEGGLDADAGGGGEVDGAGALELGFGGEEGELGGLVDELGAVQRGGPLEAVDGGDLEGGGLGEEGLGQAADQEGETGGVGDGELLERGPAAGAAGELD